MGGYLNALLAQEGVPGIFTKRITLTAAQLQAINSTPVQILPALGGTLSYAIVGSCTHYRFKTTPYAAGGTKLVLSTVPAYASNNVMWALVTIASFFTQSVDAFCFGFSNTALVAAFLGENISGDGVWITASANLTLGDGTVTVEVQYRIFDSALL